jgi:hypothetical protein
MQADLKICEKCNRYAVSKGQTVRYHRCMTPTGELLFEWMYSRWSPGGDLEPNDEFEVPADCPYILEQTVSIEG